MGKYGNSLQMKQLIIHLYTEQKARVVLKDWGETGTKGRTVHGAGQRAGAAPSSTVSFQSLRQQQSAVL